MILKRRDPRTRRQHIREALWPSMGLTRLGLYYKHRLSRLAGTPYAIGAGFATGVAISFTPFVGFHLMLALLISWMLSGDLVAMALGTLMAGNPWTLPFIWITTYKLGQAMLGQEGTRAASRELTKHQFTFTDLMHKPMDLLLPMTLGSLPFAIASWFITYYIIADIVRRNKIARIKRIRDKEAALHSKKES